MHMRARNGERNPRYAHTHTATTYEAFHAMCTAETNLLARTDSVTALAYRCCCASARLRADTRGRVTASWDVNGTRGEYLHYYCAARGVDSDVVPFFPVPDTL